jgi:hypothetical protein
MTDSIICLERKAIEKYPNAKSLVLAQLDSRGYLIESSSAVYHFLNENEKLSLAQVMVAKKGILPGKVKSTSYSLEESIKYT